MSSVIYVEETAVEATTGHMLLTFKSGGDALRFHLPAHVALRFRQAVMQDAWQVCCAPDAAVVKLQPKQNRRAKAKPE
uniref:hypothetical protein n=1 Tax=Sphingomonas sp. TaxID=28214 RepID=UPI0025E891A9|nr:hypothetical protein [Sphingomonas sp.]